MGEGESLQDYGERLYKAKDWETMKSFFQKILEECPNHNEALFFVGGALYELESRRKAEETFLRCIATQGPYTGEALETLGDMAYFEKQQPLVAVKYYQQSHDLRPK